MNESNWNIEHQCPQCGAPVILGETHRILSCPYCRTRLYIEPGDHFRYCIPSRIPSEEIVFLPYWRCKGLSFSFRDRGSDHRFLDMNLKALAVDGIPESLGLRPQAMNLMFASPQIKGRFVAPRFTLSDVLTKMTGGRVSGSSCHRFIGEIASLIFSPFYQKNDTFYDAVTNRPLPEAGPSVEVLSAQIDRDTWQPRFVSTLCPHCGWDLEGEKDAVVLICRNCQSAWQSTGRQFEQLAFAVMEHPEASLYLPFWRLQVHVEDVILDSYADLVRIANLPKAVTPFLEKKPLYFWLPAFKVNPLLFLRTARQMTIYQPEGAMSDTLSGQPYHPVNLPQSEAVEGVTVIMAEIITDKRRLLPVLQSSRNALKESLLVYHPFVRKHREWVHAHTGMAIDRNALAFGAHL